MSTLTVPGLPAEYQHLLRAEGDCLVLDGGRQHKGYRFVTVAGRSRVAHRLVCESVYGPPPGPEWVAEHACRNRGCCRPEHLRWLTNRENILIGTAPSALNARKTHCPQGHPYDGTNTVEMWGRRYCRECRRIRSAERWRREAAERAA